MVRVVCRVEMVHNWFGTSWLDLVTAWASDLMIRVPIPSWLCRESKDEP